MHCALLVACSLALVGLVCASDQAFTVATGDNIILGAFIDQSSWSAEYDSVFRLAVDTINKDATVLPSNTLTYKTVYPTSETILQSSNTLMEDDVAVIIGPSFSSSVPFMSAVVRSSQTPIISFSASAATLSSPTQYPFFSRVVGSDTEQWAAVWSVCQHYSWNRVTIIYSQDEYGRAGLQSLLDLSRMSEIVGVTVLDERIDSQLEFYKSRNARVFLVAVGSSNAPWLFQAAETAGLLSAGHAWVVPDAIARDSVLSVGSAETIRTMRRRMLGVLGTRPSLPPTTAQTTLENAWRTRNTLTYPGIAGFNNLSLYAYFMWDAVYLAAHAVETRLARGESLTHKPLATGLGYWETGPALTADIRDTSFEGATGVVSLDDVGDRSTGYDVVNLQGNTTFTKVGTWTPKNGLFLANNIVFPGGGTVQPDDVGLLGRPLHVFSKNNSAPFVSVEGGKWVGFCVDMLDELAKRVGFTYVMEHFDGNYNQLVNAAGAGKADCAVADITVLATRREHASFSHPFYSTGLRIMIKRPEAEPPFFWRFLQPFDGGLWGVILVTLFVLAHVFWWLERGHNPEFPKGYVAGLHEGFYFSSTSWVMNEPVKKLRTRPARLVLVVWLFAVVVLGASYTANLTSFLTVQRMKLPISSPEDLASATVTCSMGGSVEAYLKTMDIDKLKPLPTQEERLRLLLEGKVDAYVGDAPGLEYLAASDCRFMMVGRVFAPQTYAIVFPKESPIKAPIDAELMKLWDNNFLDNLQAKYVPTDACAAQDEASETDGLTINDLYALFVVTGVAVVTAVGWKESAPLLNRPGVPCRLHDILSPYSKTQERLGKAIPICAPLQNHRRRGALNLEDECGSEPHQHKNGVVHAGTSRDNGHGVMPDNDHNDDHDHDKSNGKAHKSGGRNGMVLAEREEEEGQQEYVMQPIDSIDETVFSFSSSLTRFRPFLDLASEDSKTPPKPTSEDGPSSDKVAPSSAVLEAELKIRDIESRLDRLAGGADSPNGSVIDYC